MNNTIINTKDWERFFLLDLFDISLAKGDLKEGKCLPGKYPLISSGDKNNGTVCYTNGESSEDEKYNSTLFEGNCITLDMFCNAFYQQNSFFAVSHGRVNILTPKKDVNKYHLLYICTLLNREKYRFSYGRAVYSKDAKKIVIKLPVTQNGDPDWQYMEDYIKSLPYGDCI